MKLIESLMEWMFNHMVLVIIGGLVLIVALGVLSERYERANPCLQRGPREVAYYQRIGDMVIPIYREPCLVRQGDSK